MEAPLPPFSCIYSPNVPELLLRLNCSIAISTYQAGKLVFISPVDENKLVQLPRNFEKAMGFCFRGNKMAIATKEKLHVLANSKDLAQSYPKQPNTYDALFMPRSTYYTGQVDIHDVHLGLKEIFAVNTSFSCIVKMSEDYSWEPIWKPSQIDELASEDRCHLNGFNVGNEDKLLYATSLGSGNEMQSWKKHIPNGGMLYDIANEDIIFDNLQMPHSPRFYNDKLFFLQSATGTVNMYDPIDKKLTVIKEVGAFLRGLAIFKDYLFIGKSKLRENSSSFNKLKIAKSKVEPGITIIHLPTRAIVGEINYKTSVDEIYDVHILENSIRPNIINPMNELNHQALSIPSSTYWAKPD